MKNKAVTATAKGIMGESKVYELLRHSGIDIKWMPYNHKADFVLPDGRLIDVKYASMAKWGKGSWMFNFHHHGKIQSYIDFFICTLEGVEGMFIFPAIFCNVRAFVISKQQLDQGRYDYFKNNYDLLKLKDLQQVFHSYS